MDEEKKEMTRWERYKGTIYKNNKKYQDKFQQVKFYCEPELYEAAKEYCAAHGESLSGFLKRLIRTEIGL